MDFPGLNVLAAESKNGILRQKTANRIHDSEIPEFSGFVPFDFHP
jgi:hypothetical protein